jgi:hypothetical protein
MCSIDLVGIRLPHFTATIFKARSKPILDTCTELSDVNTLAASLSKY